MFLVSLPFPRASASVYVDFVSEVNRRVSKIGYGVVRVRAPPLWEEYVGFVNRSASEQTKGATDYQDEAGRPELPVQAFLSACILALGSEEAEWVGGARGWPRLASSELLTLPLSEGETLPEGEEGGVRRRRLELPSRARQAALDRFARDGWLTEDPELAGHLTLGPRAYLELSNRLLQAGCPKPLADILRAFAAA